MAPCQMAQEFDCLNLVSYPGRQKQQPQQDNSPDTANRAERFLIKQYLQLNESYIRVTFYKTLPFVQGFIAHFFS